jgi:hypothetical protein
MIDVSVNNLGVAKSFEFRGVVLCLHVLISIINSKLCTGVLYKLTAMVLVSEDRLHFTAGIFDDEILYEVNDLLPYCTKKIDVFTPELFIFTCGPD